MKRTSKEISKKGRLYNFLAPLTTVVLPLMKNVLTPLAKSILVPLGLTAVESASDAAIQKKIFGLGTKLIIPNEKINNIMEIAI